MTLHRLVTAPPAELGRALERFERQFTYPLGEHARFRISHGEHYLPFFTAMGKATVLVLEHRGEVMGTLACVPRTLRLGKPTCARMTSHYLCDLKVLPRARGGLALGMLIREARRLIEPHESHACHAVVMDGTGVLPTDYTGRMGIPWFRRVADVVILRLSKFPAARTDGVRLVETSGDGLVERLECRVTGGDSGIRSRMSAVWIREEEGGASGMLEDTRRGKCLWLDGGKELVSGHVSGFQFQHGRAGAAVLKRALDLAEEAGMPGVFVSMPSSAHSELMPFMNDVEIRRSGAGIYGHDLPSGCDWWVDTAEI